MRIAILTEYYPGPEAPGNGVYVHTRAVGYRAAGHDVRVYRVRASGGEDGYEHDGIAVFSGGPTAARPDLLGFRPSVIALHTPYPGTPHVRLAESVPVPRVVWVHGYEALVTAFHGYHRGLQRALSLAGDLWKLWRLRSALPRAAAVVFVSQYLRRTVERTLWYRHPSARVIPNPVDVTRFTPAAAGVSSGRSAGVPRGLVLRPLERPRGVDVAVEAFAGLQGTELTVIGRGGEAERIRRRIERNGLPVRLERRAVPHAEMPDLLRRFQYFISPERGTPTQGVAMCEAMACGLPVIGPRAGGVPEYVRDGVDGYLIRRGDPVALRAAVRRLLEDPDGRRRMGRSAREHVIATCAAEAVLAAELELLGEASS